MEFQNVSPCLNCITFELREGSYKSRESTKVCTDIYRKRREGVGCCEDSSVEVELFAIACKVETLTVHSMVLSLTGCISVVRAYGGRDIFTKNVDIPSGFFRQMTMMIVNVEKREFRFGGNKSARGGNGYSGKGENGKLHGSG